MLAATHRLRTPTDFATTVRRGRRAGSDLLVVHLLEDSPDRPSRCGLVVSRAVGPAVVRNRVKRRLRHLMAARLDEVVPGTAVVVRALPASSRASSSELGVALDRCLSRVNRGATVSVGVVHHLSGKGDDR